MRTDIICDTGNVLDYKELGQKFISFLQKGNNKVNDWKLLDQRLDSFFGATLSIPLDTVKTEADKNFSIFLIGDNSLFGIDRGIRAYKDNIWYDNVVHNETLGLNNIFNTIFPNAQINYYKSKKNNEGIIEYSKYIINNNIKSDYIILNGIESSKQSIYYSNTSNTEKDIDIAITNLQKYCTSNSIKLVYVSIPFFLNNTEISIKGYNNFDYLICLDEILSRINFNYGEDYCYPLVEDIDIKPTRVSYIVYSYINDLINRVLLSSIFNVDYSEFFVSVMYRRIDSNSYPSWIRRSDDYMSEEHEKNTPFREVQTKYGSSNWENPFRNSGELLSIGLHTSFDYGLWMCEQGGITCKKEEDIETNDIKLLPAYEFMYGSPSRPIDLPFYPTTGCPWITHCEQDFSDFQISSDNKIIYYFIKSNYGASIAVRLHDKTKKHTDVWQCINFGAQNSLDSLYDRLCLFIGGGNQALSPDEWKYYPWSHVDGLSYDLSIRNIAFSNSNITAPCKLHGANISNSRIYNKGKWQNIWGLSQDYSIVHYFSCDAIDQQGVPLTPVQKIPYNENSGYLYTDKRFGADTNLINSDLDLLKSSSPLFPIQAFTYNISDSNPALSVASVPNAYYTSSKTIPQGINKINDNFYLCVPNGWDGRLIDYDWYCGQNYHDPWRNNEIRDIFNTKIAMKWNKLEFDKVIVDFSIQRVSFADNYVVLPSTNNNKVNSIISYDLNGVQFIYFGFHILPKNHNNVLLEYNNEELKCDEEEIYDLRVKNIKKIDLVVNNEQSLLHTKLINNSDIEQDRNKLQEKLKAVDVIDGVFEGTLPNLHALDFLNRQKSSVSNDLDCYIVPFKVSTHGIKEVYKNINKVTIYKKTIEQFSYINLEKIEQEDFIIPFNGNEFQNFFYLEFRQCDFINIYLENGYLSNNNFSYSGYIENVYLPPTIESIYFNKIENIDEHVTNIFCYSFNRLKLINTECIKFKKLHVRKEVYAYLLIDYNYLKDYFVNDIA